MYHILFFNVLFEKRGEIQKLIEDLKKVLAKVKGVELVGFFFPRGSGYMYATIIKYQDYAAWEKFWMNPKVIPVREKFNAIGTEQMDMFFDEMSYAYPELKQ